MTTSNRHAFSSIIASIALACAVSAAHASVEDEVRAAFDRFVRIQNAHDAKALEPLLADSPQFLWITRGAAVWGRDAAFAALLKALRGHLAARPGLHDRAGGTAFRKRRATARDGAVHNRRNEPAPAGRRGSC